MTKTYTIEDAPEYIYLNSSSSIVHQSIFDKGFDGDLKLLLSCVEVNIVASDDRWHEGDNDESINWYRVFADYRAALEMPAATVRQHGEKEKTNVKG